MRGLRVPRPCAVPSLPILTGVGWPAAQSRRHQCVVPVRRGATRTDRGPEVPSPSRCGHRAGGADGASTAVRAGRCGHLGADQRPQGSPTRVRPGRGHRSGSGPPTRRSMCASAVPHAWRAADGQVTRRQARRPGVSRPSPAARSVGACRRRRGHHRCDPANRGPGIAVGWCRPGRTRRCSQHPTGSTGHASKVGGRQLKHRRYQGRGRPPAWR